jgi:hypothetical protein
MDYGGFFCKLGSIFIGIGVGLFFTYRAFYSSNVFEYDSAVL